MQKRYSKTKIENAIKFWTRILENKSVLLDRLIDDFGYGNVFNDVPVYVTFKTVDVLFNTINSCVFEDKLVKWPFIKDDARCNAANSLCGYVNALHSNVEKQRFDVIMKPTILDGEKYEPPHYAFSSELINGANCTLTLVASLLAHEMIHQFTFEHEDEGAIEWLDMAYGRDYNKHGKNFERWMNIINSKYGLYVQKCGYGSIQDLNRQTMQAIRKFAGNDYIQESNTGEIHGHKILKYNKDFSTMVVFH